ncbi:RNA polymerase subunit sigma-70 [Subtercola boreus]|uniref:RNA polymerase subunit sigma-70 n=1 Tax=Subtercola boreus TaxID=120213 RepID=A0A3E0VHV2_9MICO|nr:sigma-70 family RNA polymerase sigma factor [Subtercola boreus]RFA09083.1 RNA polymerase subunit sigma-70 [Subtercola boreus]TQL53913.1 RNA polymerase ECF family sigma subunit [Subtercola boreus]
MAEADEFEQQRGRLVAIAARILDDRHEAEDIVQRTWLRLNENTAVIENLPGWLTTVTTRLCIDRLRSRVPVPVPADEGSTPIPSQDRDATAGGAPDPAHSAEQREAVGQALHVVIDRLSPNERVALVLHESFGFDFDTIGEILERGPAAARKLASRARAKIADAEPGGPISDQQVVDAFMAAARGSDLVRLLSLLAPGASVSADAAAIVAGTPRQIEGREEVAAFFNGSAHAALPVLVAGRPGFAWFLRGVARVVFDFTVVDGVVQSIMFRAEPEVLQGVVRRAKNDVTFSPSPTSLE